MDLNCKKTQIIKYLKWYDHLVISRHYDTPYLSWSTPIYLKPKRMGQIFLNALRY